MRLFKRRCSDPSPQLVSLCPIEEPRVLADAADNEDTGTRTQQQQQQHEDEVAAAAGVPGGAEDDCSSLACGGGCSEPASRETSADRASNATASPKPVRRGGLTTWSKKVSRRWDAMKRSDSSEILTSTYHQNSSRRQYSLNSNQQQQQQQLPNTQSYPSGTTKRVSRVESIRNLFARGNHKSDKNSTATNTNSNNSNDMQDLKKRFDDMIGRVSNTTNTTNTVLRRTPSGHKRRHNAGTTTEYELNEKQLLEYLLMCRPEGSNRSLDELIQNFKDTVKNTTTSTNSSDLRLSRRLSVLQEENNKKCLRHSAPVDSTRFDFLKTSNDGSGGSENHHPLTIDQLCAVLNSILAKSDESGYDSDSTRNGSDSPRGSIKSQNSEQLVYNSQLDVRENQHHHQQHKTSVPNLAEWHSNTTDGLLESMCVDGSLDDSDVSRNLLEGFNSSIRTLTNGDCSAADTVEDAVVEEPVTTSSRIVREVVDEDTREIYVGDTEDESGSDEDRDRFDDGAEVDSSRTLTRNKVQRNSFSVSRTTTRNRKPRKPVTSPPATTTNTSISSNHHHQQPTSDHQEPRSPSSSQDVEDEQPVESMDTFEDNLQRLPSCFGKLEPEFVTLGMLNKTSTGIMEEDNDGGERDFFQNCSKLSSSFEKLTETFNRQLDEMALSNSSGDENPKESGGRNGRIINTTSEQVTPDEIIVVRPGVVDELVEDFENRVRSSSSLLVNNQNNGQQHISASTSNIPSYCNNPATTSARRSQQLFQQSSVTCTPPSSTSLSSPFGLLAEERDFKCVRLRVSENDRCGLAIDRDSEGRVTRSCSSIVVTAVEKNSAADKSGNIRIGDELVKVNGCRLRGIALQEAKEILRSARGDLEIVISRQATKQSKSLDNNKKIDKSTNTSISEDTPTSTKPSNARFSNKTFDGASRRNSPIGSTTSLCRSSKLSPSNGTNSASGGKCFTTGFSNNTFSRLTSSGGDGGVLSRLSKFADSNNRQHTFGSSSYAKQHQQHSERSKSFLGGGQDQNWTLSQKVEPKIGLYTPKALSIRAKSFIGVNGGSLPSDDDNDGFVKPSTESIVNTEDRTPSGGVDIANKRCSMIENGVVWNHHAKNKSQELKSAGTTRQISGAANESFKNISDVDFGTLSNTWRERQQHKQAANKRYSMQDAIMSSDVRKSPTPCVNNADDKDQDTMNESDLLRELRLTEALRTGTPLLVDESGDGNKTPTAQSGKNPDAPKIVGGTLKPNVNPEDVVEIKKEKLHIDRSFEIESPIKKFAASPAKMAINGSIGRRSSPGKLTGMKKFYYGQKRRSLQAASATIKEQINNCDGSATGGSLGYLDRPQAEPIHQDKAIVQDRNSLVNSTTSISTSTSSAHRRSLPAVIYRQQASSSTTTTPSPSSCSAVSSSSSTATTSSDPPCTPPILLSSRPAELLRVQFSKGPGQRSLGFTIAGGRDSPRGSMGLYVKTVLTGGQAEAQGTLRTGDEILSVNSIPLSGLTRSEATAVFGGVRAGPVTLRLLRRSTSNTNTNTPLTSTGNSGRTIGGAISCPRSRKSKSCDDLDKCDGI